MENLIDLKNDTNSSLLLNQNLDYLDDQSYNALLPQNPAQVLNQNAREVNMMFNSTDDFKNNAKLNINISCQKMPPLYSESNIDSNSQTDTSSKKIKEIKVKIPIKQRNNKNYIKNNIINDENIMKDTQTLNLFYSENERLKKIMYIQNWWKITYKIIFIQKYIRSYLVKRRISFMVYFIKNVYKILFKLVINNIKFYNNNNNKNNKDISHNKFKQNNNTNKNKKTGNNNKTNKDHKTNSNYLFNESNNYCIKLKKILENSNNNNAMNSNKRNNKFKFNTTNNNKERPNNKNKKINKDKKDKEINQNITNKAQLIANNIYNIYNNVKKYYENENNNVQATNKNKKNSSLCNNDNKIKTKKLAKTGSMKNIKENNILNNYNPNKNINNSQKITKANKHGYSSTNNDKDIYSIINLLKLKKSFLFWNMYIIKKIIIQKLKNIKKIKNVSNIKKKIPINKAKKKNDQKYNSINTKKINASNSVVELKLKKDTPQKKILKTIILNKI